MIGGVIIVPDDLAPVIDGVGQSEKRAGNINVGVATMIVQEAVGDEVHAKIEPDDLALVVDAPDFSIQPQRSRVIRFCSGVGPIAGGNFSFHSQGRVASMISRLLKPFLPGSIAGSSGPLHARWMKSRLRSGSARVHTAHITSFRSVMSMSSSTTTVIRPRYAPARHCEATCPACRAWPG